MGERSLGIRSGVNKQGWEETDFPLICDPCLGDSPYINMQKFNLGKECRICQRPFTVFKWKAGMKGRFKRTEICQTCARLKNVCQTCLFDLQYGLPVEVRDKFLGENKVNIPVCDGNRDYWAQLATQNINELALPYKEMTNPILQKISRNNIVNYDRNLPQVCSFFLKGECNRGESCSFRHSKEPDLQTAYNIKDRFYGVNDPISKKILTNIENFQFVKPPEDDTITTLVVSLVEKDMVHDLKPALEVHGTLEELVLHQNHAFARFKDRKSAEAAMKNSFTNLVVKGKNLFIVWAKKLTSDDFDARSVASHTLTDGSVLVPSFGIDLKERPTAPLPKLPPMDMQEASQQNTHLAAILKTSSLQDYDNTKAGVTGGLKPQKKSLNLVNY
jgi:pre-mRNA-splicing factor RBM22/SLT11